MKYGSFSWSGNYEQQCQFAWAFFKYQQSWNSKTCCTSKVTSFSKPPTLAAVSAHTMYTLVCNKWKINGIWVHETQKETQDTCSTTNEHKNTRQWLCSKHQIGTQTGADTVDQLINVQYAQAPSQMCLMSLGHEGNPLFHLDDSKATCGFGAEAQDLRRSHQPYLGIAALRMQWGLHVLELTQTTQTHPHQFRKKSIFGNHRSEVNGLGLQWENQHLPVRQC